MVCMITTKSFLEMYVQLVYAQHVYTYILVHDYKYLRGIKLFVFVKYQTVTLCFEWLCQVTLAKIILIVRN